VRPVGGRAIAHARFVRRDDDWLVTLAFVRTSQSTTPTS